MQEKEQLQEDLKKINPTKFNEAMEGLTPEEIATARAKAAELVKQRKKEVDAKNAELNRQKKLKADKIRKRNKTKNKLQKQSRKRNR